MNITSPNSQSASRRPVAGGEGTIASHRDKTWPRWGCDIVALDNPSTAPCDALLGSKFSAYGNTVDPSRLGLQPSPRQKPGSSLPAWIPAFAGMTKRQTSSGRVATQIA